MKLDAVRRSEVDAQSIAYDKQTIEAWKAASLDVSLSAALLDLKPLPRRYRSNWRLLHVDGFEAGAIQFFRYTPVKYQRALRSGGATWRWNWKTEIVGLGFAVKLWGII